jgi:WD40 repeat protein
MSRAWSRWFVRAGGLALVACTDSFVPPPPYQQIPVKLAFAAQPGTTTAGVPFGPSLAVIIEDSAGDTVKQATATVTMQFDRDLGVGVLIGPTSVAAVHGVATFSNLRIDKTGVGYTLKAVATGLSGVTSEPFTIIPGPGVRLLFVVQPSNAMGGTVISPPVQVAAQDSVGNRATGFAGSVTVALGANPPAGTLSGTTTASANGGVATFATLSIAQAGIGYTLTASAAGLTGANSASFAVAPPTASLHITAPTSGTSFDPDGYSACVDSSSDGYGGTTCAYGGPLAVGVNGSGTVKVDTGAHTVLLTGVTANCTIAGDNPQAVRVMPGATTEVSFAITCSPATLHVTTTTTGASIDTDGYSLCVDPGYYGCSSYDAPIGVNDSATVPVDPGTHYVELGGVAPNCTVSGGNQRAVDGGTPTEVPYAITCVAAGTLRLTATSTGIDVPYGYSVCVDTVGTTCAMWAFVPANGATPPFSVSVGPHTVTLVGLAGNCTVTGDTTRAVTVPQDSTVDVAFAVGCIEAERIAFSYYGAITVIHADGSAAHSLASGYTPAWSPSGTRLAYECGLDICAINADSTGFARLTTDAADNRHPTWSPDGTKIAFAATHAGVTDLYVMAANGSGAARVTQGVGFVGNPAWSPDGMTIVFDCRVDASNNDLCSVNTDGTGFARLTTDPAGDYGAAWKPDGSTLAFATARYGADEIALLNVAGGTVTRIGAGLPGFAPTWSSDGTQVALVQQQESCDYYYCYTVDEVAVATVDGSRIHYVSPGDQPAWRPHP